MTTFIFEALAIIFFLAILLSTGINRLYWFFIGIIFFPNGILVFYIPSIGGMPFPRLLVYALLFSELLRPQKFFPDIKRFPFRKVMLIILIGFLLIGILDTNVPIVEKISRPVFEFIETFFLLFLCYNSIDKIEDWEKLLKLLVISSIILCLYGFYNFITYTNPYFDIIQKEYGSISFFEKYLMQNLRFRVNSFASHPIYYGYLVGVFFIILLSGYITKKKSIVVFITLILLWINLFLTNSRTPIAVFFIGIMTFTLLSIKPRMIIK